jgi:inosine-uridine nucleoside N-ribohydrolase
VERDWLSEAIQAIAGPCVGRFVPSARCDSTRSGASAVSNQVDAIGRFRLRELIRGKASVREQHSSLVPNRLSMKRIRFRILAVSVLAAHLGPAARQAVAVDKRPMPLLFDTDIGNDVDDALALGVIHALVSRGECELVAVTVTKDEPLSPSFVDAVNTFYGRGDIPIGVIRDGPTREPSKFTGLANVKDGDELRYPHKLMSGADAPEAVALLRRMLAEAEDGTVVIVQVGFSTNLARLLKSVPNEACRLSGFDLVQKKVRLLSVMAGSFGATDDRPQPEYNVKMDVASAQSLFSDWPTPIVFSGFEIGKAVTFPAESIERDFAYVAHHPLAEAYILYKPPPHCRPLWDLTSVLYAVRPDCGYFDLSPPGRVHVASDGTTSFEAESSGSHRFLILKPERQIRVREALTQLASQPPSFARPGR